MANDHDYSTPEPKYNLLGSSYLLVSFEETIAIKYEGRDIASIFNDWSGGQFENLRFPHTEYHVLHEIWCKAYYAKMMQWDMLDAWGREVVMRLIYEIPDLQDETRDRAPAEKLSPASPKQQTGYIYLLKSPTSAYKIGRTRNPKDRLKTFSVKLPFEVEYIALIPTDDMVELERVLHARFDHRRINGEWFELSPDEVAYIKELEQQ